jgi:hypothetical protein
MRELLNKLVINQPFYKDPAPRDTDFSFVTEDIVHCILHFFEQLGDALLGFRVVQERYGRWHMRLKQTKIKRNNDDGN